MKEQIKQGDFFIIKHDNNENWQSWSGPYEVEDIRNGCVFYINNGKIQYRKLEDCVKYEV